MEVTTLVRTVGLDLLKPALPQRQLDGHKGTFGKLLIGGGAVGYTGAPYLTASAAVRTGCGLVSLGVPKTIWPIEAAKCVSANGIFSQIFSRKKPTGRNCCFAPPDQFSIF